MRAKSLQLCPILCDPVGCRPPDFHGSVGFSTQEYWSELPCPSPRDFSNLGIEIMSLISPALAGMFFDTSTTWEDRSNLEMT